MVSSAAKRARRKKLAHERQDRELLRPTHQMDLVNLTDPEMKQNNKEVRFAPRGQSVEQMPATPATAQAATDCEYVDVVNMIKTLKQYPETQHAYRGRMNSCVLKMSPETKP